MFEYALMRFHDYRCYESGHTREAEHAVSTQYHSEDLPSSHALPYPAVARRLHHAPRCPIMPGGYNRSRIERVADHLGTIDYRLLVLACLAGNTVSPPVHAALHPRTSPGRTGLALARQAGERLGETGKGPRADDRARPRAGGYLLSGTKAAGRPRALCVLQGTDRRVERLDGQVIGAPVVGKAPGAA